MPENFEDGYAKMTMMVDILAGTFPANQINVLGIYQEVRPDMTSEDALRQGLVEVGLLDPTEDEEGGPDDEIGLRD